jgi:hypothetical protein
MESTGFIRLSRGFFEHSLWEEEGLVFHRREAWLDCIRMAAWRPFKKLIGGAVVEVPRGGFVASVRYLSDRWLWSNTKVCAFLDLLRVEGMITTEKRHLITVVLLCNFDKYNEQETTQKRQENDAEATRRRRGDDEIEEDKEEEEGGGARGKASLNARTEPPVVHGHGWFPSILNTPDFRKLWLTWEDHCRERGASLSSGARRGQLVDCDRAGIDRASAVIRASIGKNSRAILYWDFDEARGGAQRPTPKPIKRLPTADEMMPGLK